MSDNEKQPLHVNDPKNYRPVSEMFDEQAEPSAEPAEEAAPTACSRRNFLKVGGLAAAATTVAGAAGAGFQIGKSSDAYTGYGRTNAGDDMFFNREPFRVDKPTAFDQVGEVTRPDWTDYLFKRKGVIGKLIKTGKWNPEMGLEALPGPVGEFYRNKPVEEYETMIKSLKNAVKQEKAWKDGKYLRYAVANGYAKAYKAAMFNSHGSTFPESPTTPPEEWDFRNVKLKEPLKFKSKKHATELIKRMAHVFGASVVGITKFDERFMFKNIMRGTPKGGRDWGDKVPSHWKSVIVFGAPMYWDNLLSAVGYSSSYDGYFRSRVTAGLLEQFLNQIGYSGRAQVPPRDYEIMMTPFTLLSGLGEYSRAGLAMVPELGSNFRPSAVITNLEFEYDKPIDLKMMDFCEKCKICAETCPSGAISKADRPETVVRGFRRWKLDEEKCHLMWRSGSTSDGDGCRVCIGVCPYTRKNTWIHTISREVEPRDPTGLTATGLLAMQNNFFKYPEAEAFKSDWDGGKEATYHKPPKWLRSEEYFEIDQTWEYEGM